MRFKLSNGKQKELILLAKGNSSWNELSRNINVGSHYLAFDLKNEICSLKEEVYYKLCEIARTDFDKHIIGKYSDNWGRSKGGINSEGRTIYINSPEPSKNLAEFYGALLGDGNICNYEKKEAGVYQVKIAGDMRTDVEYHSYLKMLVKDLFGLQAKKFTASKNNGLYLVISSKKLVEFLIKEGFLAGNKIKNKITMPNWVWSKEEYMRSCLRGLIDTDGCIFQMSKRDSNLLRISFTNYNTCLLNDARDMFIKLGFSPTKTIQNKRFFISKQGDIRKYLKEIGFSNEKHRLRLSKLTNSPVV